MTNKSFSRTLTAQQAFAMELHYQQQGYDVTCTEIGFPNPVTGLSKFYFSLRASSKNRYESYG